MVNPFRPADPVATMWGMAEAYAVVPHQGGYVTTGYGRAAATGTVDMVSVRFDAGGERDLTWGEGGTAVLDLVGQNDRGRHAVTLSDGRVVVVGSGSTSASNVDAMVAVLTAEGDLDRSFAAGDGYKLYSFGRADEAFFQAVVAPGDRLIAAGYRAGETGGQPEDEDGVLLILPFGGGDEIAMRAPASETLDDRWWSVARDDVGRIYAAGFVTEAGDARFAVGRFDATGAPDASFGEGGVAVHNVVASGTFETARAVVIQSDGKVVLVGHAERR
jgi:uncharacterized delta-60 repeat protein